MSELSTKMIVFGILTRVPPKAVGRFKSVFLFIELQTSSIHPINFETHAYEPGTSITIPFFHLSYDNRFNPVSVLSHFNGLLCVYNRVTSDLFLWNPVTTSFKRLPHPYSNDFYKGTLDAVGMYTDTHDDLKVMYIRRRDATLAVNVYSRSVESWRNIPLTLHADYLTTRFCWSSGTLCGGTLYFTVSETVVGGIHFMISFDVNTEEFEMFNLPPIPNHGIVFISLVNAQNELVMFAASGHRSMKIDMWILTEVFIPLLPFSVKMKAQNEASACSPGPGTSASRPQNAKCSNCLKLKQDIMELKKKLEWYKNPQKKTQSAGPCDDMGELSLK
ncbi:F-box domain-containing protein [Artemisia annua]|uniref:F-box domain-containing protein n=1 Tax=Artemisia annua TaxID=35608 RepID=A0A2U1LWD6_ARTAN|nr:F-box domain-containing protein [Artemisia annua]